MLKNILQFIYPQTCRQCGDLIKHPDVFCSTCISSIKPIVNRFLPVTKNHVLKVFAVSAYQNPLKSMILKKFYKDKLASKQLGQLIMQLTTIKNENFDLIVPIPLHWTRYAKRGFNQAHVIAKEIGKETQKPVYKLLRRHKKTKFQSSLTSPERHENIAEAFSIHWLYSKKCHDLIEGKTILIVDDLCTTGTTLKVAAKMFTKYKPKSIIAAVACRTL
jgi:ComF family protein